MTNDQRLHDRGSPYPASCGQPRNGCINRLQRVAAGVKMLALLQISDLGGLHGIFEVANAMRTTLVWFGVLGFLLLPGCGPKEAPKPPAQEQKVTEKTPPPPTGTRDLPVADSSTMEATDAAKDEAEGTTGQETPAANPYPYEQLVAEVGNKGLTEAYKQCEDELRANPTEGDLKMQRVYLLNTAGSMFMSRQNQKQALASFRAAFELAQQLVKDNPDPPEDYRQILAMVYYNGACARSLDGQADAAKEALGQAIAWGWSDIDAIKNDSDLANVRALTGFDADLANWAEQVQQVLAEKAREELAQGETFPFDLQVEDLTGAQIKLADYAGKVLIVDFWGTWCPPCRAEIPSFVKLQQQYGPQGLQIIGLSYENMEAEQAKTTVQEFIKSNGINYPCALGTEELQNQVPQFEAYPTTLFIDKTGKVRLKIVGMHEYSGLESLVKVLLAEPAETTPPAQ